MDKELTKPKPRPSLKHITLKFDDGQEILLAVEENHNSVIELVSDPLIEHLWEISQERELLHKNIKLRIEIPVTYYKRINQK